MGTILHIECMISHVMKTWKPGEDLQFQSDEITKKIIHLFGRQ